MEEPKESPNSGNSALPMLGCVGWLLLGLVQIGAGFAGIADHWGVGWAILALIAMFVFRFSLPITIGAFFAARDLWGWHWLFAILFAAPGLAFMIPGVISSIISRVKR